MISESSLGLIHLIPHQWNVKSCFSFFLDVVMSRGGSCLASFRDGRKNFQHSFLQEAPVAIKDPTNKGLSGGGEYVMPCEFIFTGSLVLQTTLREYEVDPENCLHLCQVLHLCIVCRMTA